MADPGRCLVNERPQGSGPLPPIARAREDAHAFRQAHSVARHTIVGLRNLFGTAVFDACTEPLRQVIDRGEDAFRSYEQAVTDRDEEIDRLNRVVNAAVVRGEASRALGERAVRELIARYERAHKPAPAWLMNAAVDLAEEPF